MKRSNEIAVYVSDEQSEAAVADILRRPTTSLRPAVRVYRFRGVQGWRVVSKVVGRSRSVGRDAPAIILATLSQLGHVAEVASSANHRNRLRGLLIREEGESTTNDVLHSMSEARVRIHRNILVHRGMDVPRRVIAAWVEGVQDEAVADAYVVGETLTVYDCSMKRFEIRFDQLEVLAVMEASSRSGFELDEDGSFLYWPDSDVHVNIEMIREALEPEFRAAHVSESEEHHKQYGRVIAALRKRSGLRQTDFPDLSERQLRRIESGAPARLAALQALADGHRLGLDEYLERLAETSHEESPMQA